MQQNHLRKFGLLLGSLSSKLTARGAVVRVQAFGFGVSLQRVLALLCLSVRLVGEAVVTVSRRVHRCFALTPRTETLWG